MVIFIFLKFGMMKVGETLQTLSNVKMIVFQIKILNKITLLLFIIDSFIKFKVKISLTKGFHGPLGYSMRMYCNWPTDHDAIDHSSTGLNRLTIASVHCLHFLGEHMALTSRFERTTLILPVAD